MKELTDKVNMDNLSLIIKTLRSKATSSTFFNKSNTKLLLKLAVAFYQFKDKSLEEVLKLAVHNYCKMSTQSDMFSFYKIIYSTRATNCMAAQIMCEETEKMLLATKNLFYALQVHQKIFVKDIDQAAISFTMTIHSLIDYQLDRKSAGNKFNEDILDNYICWFSKEFGGKDEENID